MTERLTQNQIDAKRALLNVAHKEMNELVGRFLTKEEQLRALSLGEEIDRLEAELLPYDLEEFG
jgi:hypothetical protein